MTDNNTSADTPTERETRLAAFLSYVISRSNEASSVRGFLTAIVLVVGVAVKPDRLDAVATVVASVSAALKVLLPDDLTPVFKAVVDFFKSKPKA